MKSMVKSRTENRKAKRAIKEIEESRALLVRMAKALMKVLLPVVIKVRKSSFTKTWQLMKIPMSIMKPQYHIMKMMMEQ